MRQKSKKGGALIVVGLICCTIAYIVAAWFPFKSASTNVYVLMGLIAVVLVALEMDEKLLNDGVAMVLGFVLLGCLWFVAQRIDFASDERAFSVYLSENHCRFELRDEDGVNQYACPGETSWTTMRDWKIQVEVDEEARLAGRPGR